MTAEQNMQLHEFQTSDAVNLLRLVDNSPISDDGVVSELDLSLNQRSTAWGLVSAGLLTSEVIAQTRDIDGNPLPEWGFMLNEDGAGALLAIRFIDPTQVTVDRADLRAMIRDIGQPMSEEDRIGMQSNWLARFGLEVPK